MLSVMGFSGVVGELGIIKVVIVTMFSNRESPGK